MKDEKDDIPCCMDTKLVQIGNRSESATGAVNTPVYLSTAYRHEGIGKSSGYDYSRTGNPTRHVLEEAVASLEEGDQAFATSSGMAAIQTVFGLFQQGDEIIVSYDLYGGSYRLFEQILQNYGITFHYADIRKPAEFEQLINDHTKALFIESPTNPLMQEADLNAFGKLANEYNILLIVDNTFYTPILQQPILEGAHIVIHSATKYLGGHNDVLAGIIVAKGKSICERLEMLHNGIGAVLSPFDSWLLIRGMKTLALRMRQHEENAKGVLRYLEESSYVDEVLYPGRGGMISFRVKHESMVPPFLENLKLITFAESLGGVESFITFPATQTHADIPEDIRMKNGICNRLLRFSVGVENINDILRDLQQALQKGRELGEQNE